MNEIEVGEYIRTRNHGIKRVDIINQNATVNKYGYEIGSDWEGKEYGIVKTTEVLNHSKNIKELIEAGDFVNGLEVYRGKTASGKEKLLIGNHLINGMALEIANVKTILTKEQYEQNCYRLEE